MIARAAVRRCVLVGAAAVVGAAVLAGCTLPAPPGAAPLRYRDQVFSTVDVQHDLDYGSAPDNSGTPVALKLDLYQPSGDTVTRRPAVVWIHGGSFTGGDKSDSKEVKLANTFAKLGYVAVSINYRLLDPGTPCAVSPVPPACVTAALAAQHDAQAAVRWLRANADTYRIDPNRIAVGGTSAGAGTALLVGVNSEDTGTSGNPGYPSNVQGVVSISGALPDNSGIGPGDAPTLMFNGTADTVVPYSIAVANAQAFVQSGDAIVFEALDGAGHVPWSQYHDQFITQSDYFLYDFLDLAHAAG